MVSDVNLVTFSFFAVLGVRVGRVAQVLAARSIKTTSDVVLLPRRENTSEVVSIAAVRSIKWLENSLFCPEPTRWQKKYFCWPEHRTTRTVVVLPCATNSWRRCYAGLDMKKDYLRNSCASLSTRLLGEDVCYCCKQRLLGKGVCCSEHKIGGEVVVRSGTKHLLKKYQVMLTARDIAVLAEARELLKK